MTEPQTEWERFRSTYAADPDMQEELEARLRRSTRTAAAEVHEYAQEKGFEIEPAEVEEFFASAPRPAPEAEELSDDDLDNVAGGYTVGGRVVPSQTKVLLMG